MTDRRWSTRLASVCLLACAAACGRPHPASLHVVDGEVVSSRPAAPRAYEAYLRARLELESDAPDLDRALRSIDLALRYDPKDPHLWTTRAEVNSRGGDLEAARVDLERALTLSPGYEPAQQLLAQIGTTAGG